MNYFKKHWKGELSLPLSYWVNFILVNVLIIYIIEYLSNKITHPFYSIKFIILLKVFSVTLKLSST